MDTAKSVFQPHGVDEHEVVVVRRQLRRTEMIRSFEKLPTTLVAIDGSDAFGVPTSGRIACTAEGACTLTTVFEVG